jgi:transcriptional regulator with XRE-family HTH domain
MPPGRRKQHHLGIRHRLKHLRSEQKLNPTELARKAGLSRTAVSHIEVGRGAPGVDTIEDLAYALSVPPSWLAFGDAGTVMQETHKIAPGFDPIQLADEIAHLVNGCGGVIGTKFLYFEPSGASDWRALVDVYRGLPIELAIPRLVEEIDHSPIDVIGLGVGTCHHETNLVLRPGCRMSGSSCSISARLSCL